MGVDYRQYCMIGVCFDLKDLKKVTSKAEYQLENRYDTKTGKVTHQEKILVKEEEFHYELCGHTFEYIDDMKLDGLDIEIDHEYEDVYVGLPITKSKDIGRVYLLQNSLDMSSLEKLHNKVRDILPQYADSIGLHFFYIVN